MTTRTDHDHGRGTTLTAEQPVDQGVKASESPTGPVEERRADRENKTWARLLRLVGGLVILSSLFLPFMGAGGYSLYNRVNAIIPQVVPMFTYYFSQPPEVVPQTVPITYMLLIAGFITLLASGLYCFRRGTTGGIAGIVGIILVIAAFAQFTGLTPSTLIYGGPGYYAAAAGSITAILSRWFKVKPPMDSSNESSNPKPA